MQAACPAELDACSADPECAKQLQCAIDQGEVTDRCGGAMPQPMIDCLMDSCGGACMVPTSDKVSQVIRRDPRGMLEVVHPQAPVRIVGAGASVCVPDMPK